ncbi:MAG: glycoside hydrolase family 13 protein [Gemmatimonadota bacterium]
MRYPSTRSLVFSALLFVAACATDAPESTEPVADAMAVPAWSKDVVWYQVFVERFRNGDPSNDPTLDDMVGAWPDLRPDGWEPTPWTQDWFRQEDWAEATGEPFYYTAQLRRYGGDLQGVIDQLDYLQDLGVTAIFFNPINDSPSLHKYDARNYRHIDRNFGPDPAGDVAIMEAEDPADPATWTWTAADRLFLALVDEVHRRGMRIIVDYSWNHTGTQFWAWQDVLAKQEASPYADWYEIERFDDAATPDTNEFTYSGWAGVPNLPEWRKIGRPEGARSGAVDGTLVPGVRELVFDVTRRWLDPNGDGDPSDGVDGFRLDVAEIVPLDFWREYRRVVREINPEAYLVGEVWWEKWPEAMFDTAPWLQGDVFDAVMNYRWYEPTRSFFASAPPYLTASQYVAALDSVAAGIPDTHLQAMMNLTASHDSPRFGTSIYNPGRYKHRVNPRENPDFKIDKPDLRTREIQEMILVQQFTYIGAPHIWYGDEVGMWGGDDPDPRKPMIWSDLEYEPEVLHPMGATRRASLVTPDPWLRGVYQRLIDLRQGRLRLFVDGDLEWVLTSDANRLLACRRSLGDEQVIVAFNASEDPQEIEIPAENGTWHTVYQTGRYTEGDVAGITDVASGTITARLAPLSARVWERVHN